jgi:hypothetical protein
MERKEKGSVGKRERERWKNTDEQRKEESSEK